MMGSSEIQPFGLSSTVDPLRCRHLNKKFTETNSEQIACEDVYGVDQRETRLNPHARIRFWVLPLNFMTELDPKTTRLLEFREAPFEVLHPSSRQTVEETRKIQRF
jgi:hypothetical protein